MARTLYVDDFVYWGRWALYGSIFLFAQGVMLFYILQHFVNRLKGN